MTKAFVAHPRSAPPKKAKGSLPSGVLPGWSSATNSGVSVTDAATLIDVRADLAPPVPQDSEGNTSTDDEDDIFKDRFPSLLEALENDSDKENEEPSSRGPGAGRTTTRVSMHVIHIA